MPNEIAMPMRIPRDNTQETWQAHLQKIADRFGQQCLEKQQAEKVNMN